MIGYLERIQTLNYKSAAYEKDQMKVSVAMATYNGSTYLKDQLHSFLDQTRLPDELVVCDDASTDTTLDILKMFVNEAPFMVRIYQNANNRGHNETFGRALSHCEGDLIVLSDQDDFWFSEKIETLVSEVEVDQHNFVFMNDAELADENLLRTGRTKIDQIRAAGISPDTFVMGCCTAIRSDFLRYVLPIPVECLEYDDWIVSFANGINRCKVIEKPLQLYRRHQSNVTASTTDRFQRANLLLYIYDRAKVALSTNTLIMLEATVRQTNQLIARVDLLAADEKTDPEMIENLVSYKRTLLKKGVALQGRANAQKMSRPMRIFPVLNMLLKGDYRNFNGLTTALRDIFFR